MATIRIFEKKDKYVAAIVAVIGLLSAAVWYFHNHTVAVLQPSGTVALKERHLIIVSLLLAAIVVVPVYAMTIAIALRYREGNPKHQDKYAPEWDHDSRIEFTWWAIPGVIILILSVIAWNSAHDLDPFKPLASGGQSLKINVVSLDWKWLFIYPDQGVASVNYLRIPANVPVDFHVTSDSVMNSFWVPALGSQIYSMPGMDTQVHLMATETGTFTGSSANISGVGFAGMAFTVQATGQDQFGSWIRQLQSSPQHLDQTTYNHLAKPSQNNPVAYYSSASKNLYTNIVLKYAPPSVRFAALLNQQSSGVSQ